MQDYKKKINSKILRDLEIDLQKREKLYSYKHGNALKTTYW